MAYGNYQNGYQMPIYGQQVYPQMQAQQPQQPQNGIQWVQGEAGAKSYLVANGSSVLLMDSEKQTFYIKSADAAGMPSMRTFDYVERNASVKPSSSAQDAPEYVTRDELNTLTKRLEALEGRKKKGVTQDEPTV